MSNFNGNAGGPIPDFSTAGIDITTVAPALGVKNQTPPDYLDYDQTGRGVMTTMFANTGASYAIGTTLGGLYGFREGLTQTPSSRIRVKLNSVLNHCGRYGSRAGNIMGVGAIMFSLLEWGADSLEIDKYTPLDDSIVPPIAAFMTGAAYKASAGPRVAALAGTISLGAVGVTYLGYGMFGVPYGSKGFLFF